MTIRSIIYRFKRFLKRKFVSKEDFKLRIKNFFDHKYRKKRKEQQKYAKETYTMDRVPVERATSTDGGNLCRPVGNNTHIESKMKCIKLKSGRVVVTPATLDQIRRNPMYEGAVLVESRVKSDDDLD
jgi:hypothetical protein